MYQWWLAQQQADLENRPLSEPERMRVDLLTRLDEETPSLFQRIVSIFRAEPEGPQPFIARTLAEAELIGTGIIGRDGY
jgi:hypothetical protein